MDKKEGVLLVTSNGVGLGHLSRVMAIAQQLKDDFEPVIFTLSSAISIPISQGFRTEYLRSHDAPLLDAKSWQTLLERRLNYLNSIYLPRLILFDGTYPYAGLVRFLLQQKHLKKVWLRRGMWRKGIGHDAIKLEQFFDLVIEPGDYASDYDTGATSTSSIVAERVSPIIFAPVSLTREAAREELGIKPNETAALVQLGVGKVNDVPALIHAVTDELTNRGISTYIAVSVLSDIPKFDHPKVRIIRSFPVSKYFSAFDFGLFPSGYNSFHEALSLELPAIFVPNAHTKLDDQTRRSKWAVDQSLAFEWTSGEAESLAPLIEQMISDKTRSEMKSRMSLLSAPTGAFEVANIINAAFRGSKEPTNEGVQNPF